MNTMHKIPLLAFLFIFSLATAIAQNVGIVDIALHPKPNPHFSAWAKLGDSLRLRVVNSDTLYHSVKIPIRIMHRETLIADTDTNLLPAVGLEPGMNVVYAEELIRPEALRVHRFEERRILSSGRLLPGEYVLHVGGARRPFQVDPWPELHALAPASGDTTSLRMPVTFRWSSMAMYPEDRISYRIRIAPLLPGQSPDTAFTGNQPIFDHTIPDATEWIWDGAKAPASAAAYVWSVQGLDEEGLPISAWTPPSILIPRRTP